MEPVLNFRRDLALIFAVIAAAATAVACAGPDQGRITFTEGAATSVGETSPSGEDDDGAGDSAMPASFEAVFSALTPCLECHINGEENAVKMMASDAAGTHKLFLEMGYEEGTVVQNKGAHAGPALSDEGKAAVVAWQKDEGG